MKESNVTNRVPLPLTETWGTLPELVAVADAEALASSLAGVAAAWARAAEAATIAIALFMVVRIENMVLCWRLKWKWPGNEESPGLGGLLWICGYVDIQSESGGSSE
jgi:hypothetical protein